MGQNFKLPDDYNTVAERIAEFRDKYPEGSLQPADLAKPYDMASVNGNVAFLVVAAAYRTPDDARPGIGMAYEPVPGSTPYTRGSELQNAETAAWGRAIVAALAADTKKGIASSEEVRNRQAEQEPETKPAVKPWDMEQARKAISFAKGNEATLRKAWAEAQSSGADQAVLDAIKAAAAPKEPVIEGTVQ